MLVKVSLNLPKSTVDAYESEGDLSQVLESRLLSAVSHTSQKPLYVTDEIRKEFDKLFGRNFDSASELLAHVKKALTVRVDNVRVPLNPILLTRLKTRCFGLPFEDFIAKQTIKGLEEFTEMR